SLASTSSCCPLQRMQSFEHTFEMCASGRRAGLDTRAASPPATRPASWLSADADEFLVHELVRAEPAELAADAAALHPAERELRTVGTHDVHVHHARLDAVGDATRLLLIGRVEV